MEKLPEDFKRKWLEALRSGEFKQGKNHLVTGKEDKSYCCLGVACKVCGIDDSNLRHDFIPSEGMFEDENFKCVPAIIKGEDGIAAHLAEMNDNEKMSFEEIADYIEKEL